MLLNLQKASYKELLAAFKTMKVGDHIVIQEGLQLINELPEVNVVDFDSEPETFTQAGSIRGSVNKKSGIYLCFQFKMFLLNDGSLFVYRQKTKDLNFNVSNRVGWLREDRLPNVINGEFNPDWVRVSKPREGYVSTRNNYGAVSDIVIPSNAQLLVSVVVAMDYDPEGNIAAAVPFPATIASVNGGYPGWNG